MLTLDDTIKLAWNAQVTRYKTLSQMTGIRDAFLDVRLRPIIERPWNTENTVVFTDSYDKTELRLFKKVPCSTQALVLVMPEAGHDGKLGDYADNQSLVRTAVDSFQGNVYLLNKLPARMIHADYDLDDCIDSLHQAINFIGYDSHLVGLCQGGSSRARSS